MGRYRSVSGVAAPEGCALALALALAAALRDGVPVRDIVWRKERDRWGLSYGLELPIAGLVIRLSAKSQISFCSWPAGVGWDGELLTEDEAGDAEWRMDEGGLKLLTDASWGFDPVSLLAVPPRSPC